MSFIVKILMMLVALVMSVFYPVPVLVGSVMLFLYVGLKPQPARGLADLIFPEGISTLIMSFVVMCASGVSLAVQLLG